MILKTLHALGPLHGFGIARRIEQISEEVLQLNEGTVYTSLLRLQQQGCIACEWGASENNRKVHLGAAIAPAQLKPSAPRPADFDSFLGWEIESLERDPDQ